MTTILVGVDGSQASDTALQWALAEAGRWGAAVSVVCAWQPLPYAVYTPGMVMPPVDLSASEAQADSLVADAVKRAQGGVPGADSVPTTARSVMGHAPQVLEQESRGVDLVVLGCRAAGAVERAVLGSTSNAVLHHAQCPVVVVPEGASPTASGEVVVGVDGTPAAAAALGWAAAEADRRQARLLAVHVRPPLTDVTGVVGLPEVQAGELAWLREQTESLQLAGTVESEARVGHPGEELARGLSGDDLLVVGSRGLGALRGWLLGSTSRFVAHHAHCPVAIVREPASDEQDGSVGLHG